MEKQIIINGDNFSDLETFYTEIDRLFTKELNWKTGHNLDAFNDLLYGGFGVYKSGEPIKIVWTNFAKSSKEIEQNILDNLINIIKSHNHIEFKTEY